MWYLVLVFVYTYNGAMTSQSIPVGKKEKCEAQMKVFDQAGLELSGASLTPRIRAICIEGK